MKTLIVLAALLLTACQIPAVQPPRPVIEEATFKMLTGDGAQGTAWAIDEHHLVTAGHMCNEGDTYAMVNDSGISFQAKLVDYAEIYPDDDIAREVPEDVCLLSTDYAMPVHLDLADAMPEVGDVVHYVGYPKGKWISSYGTYEGDVDADSHWDDYSFNAPCDHGASGSAVVSKDGVFGVLVRVKILDGKVMPGTLGCVVSPLAAIREILGR